MTRESFREELRDLRAAVVALGRDVLDGFERAADALADGDEAAAREGRCIDLLALQQPVAGDLRFVTSTFKILTDIERIGDLATNLAEQALQKRADHVPDVNVADLTDIAAEMVVAALDAYERGDPEACHAVADQDDELDGLCQRVADIVIEDLVGREGTVDDGAAATDAGTTDLLTGVRRLLLTVRDVERVGDHAVNIAARTLYMIEGSETLLY